MQILFSVMPELALQKCFNDHDVEGLLSYIDRDKCINFKIIFVLSRFRKINPLFTST